jgi:hypothetical protein
MKIKSFLTIPLIFLFSFGLSGCSNSGQHAQMLQGSPHIHSVSK